MLTQARLHELLHYEPETGVFTWRRPPRRGIRAGSVAGSIGPDGRRQIGVDGCDYLASRLAWLYMTGAWPKDEIDHEDRDPGNNRWTNLRNATRAQQIWNRGANRNSSCGFKGVYRRGARWCAKLNAGRQQIHLGTFDSPAEAHAAYKAEVRSRHGSFAGV